MQMRQVKAFMKAKKPMWRCGECKCITLQCRKENDEFCNCGENVTPPVPPVPPVTTYTVDFDHNPKLGGNTSVSQLEVNEGTTITYNGAGQIIVGDVAVDAIPGEGYVFDFWSDENGNELPNEVTGNMTVVANFSLIIPVESITGPDDNDVSVIQGEYVETYFHFLPANATDLTDRVEVTNNTGNAVGYISAYNTEGEGQIRIEGITEGSDTITYSLDNVSFDINVTVTPPL